MRAPCSTRLKLTLSQSVQCLIKSNVIIIAFLVLISQQAAAVTPFKLATYKNNGNERPAMVCGDILVDIAGASQYLDKSPDIVKAGIPDNLRELIESYESLKPRLYDISDQFCDKQTTDLSFVYPLSGIKTRGPDQVSIQPVSRRGKLSGSCRGDDQGDKFRSHY